MERRSEKELLESNIIVESSLNKELEKNRRISELVNEKFVNNEELLKDSYKRYLENKLREAFGFFGTPIRISVRERKEKGRK